MQKLRWSALALSAFTALALSLSPSTGRAAVIESGNEAPWNLSLGGGIINFEGDEELKDGFISAFTLGYDFNERWTIEGVFYFSPKLDANEVTDSQNNPRRGLGGDNPATDTYLLGAAVDGLWHFTRWERLDPYLVLGFGGLFYGEELANGDKSEAALRAGFGVMYHFNDEWALRADFRGMLAGNDSEANSIITGGLVWTPGAHVPPSYRVVGGPLDTDGEGLPDDEEARIGTDPRDKDTDHDGLTDFEEVKKYGTDPLNADTDYDALKDGPEVYTYKTNPLKADTDDGGVSDGHEVLEDDTNPLNGKDDLILFTLYLKFDYDKAVIKPEYFKDIDVIGKTLARDPGATAKLEGHADKLKKSSKTYNQTLSERRAQAVLDYLADKSKIARGRMSAAGYGFNRPKAANDPVNGNPVNRRVEVYIRPSGHVKATEDIVSGAVQLSPNIELSGGGSTNSTAVIK